MEQNWESKISPYIYGQLISNKNDNTMRKEVFSTNGARTTGYSHVNEWSWMDLYLTPYTKVNSKWMKDLNIELKLYNSEENIGVNHHDLALGNGFFNTWHQKYDQPKKKKLEFTKILNFCASKNVKKVKRQRQLHC